MSTASLANISNSAMGVSGILMAVPQFKSLLPGQKSAQNTIGYQPTLQNGTSVNPPALIFHYEGEQSVECRSNITDHYSEENIALQNQIALAPVRITTQGFVGELTDAPPNAVLAALQLAAQKLSLVPGLTPGFSLTALDAYNQAAYAYSVAQNAGNAAISAFSSLVNVGGEAVVTGGTGQSGITNTSPASGLFSSLGLGSQSKQQIYFQQFFGYWNSRTLFTVQTPWAVFLNMAIETLRPVQDADSNMITEFSITFKQMRFAQTGASVNTAQVDASPSTRLAAQTSPNVNFASSNLSDVVAQPSPPNTLPAVA